MGCRIKTILKTTETHTFGYEESNLARPPAAESLLLKMVVFPLHHIRVNGFVRTLIVKRATGRTPTGDGGKKVRRLHDGNGSRTIK